MTLENFTPVTPDPLVTYYDVTSGERVELSGATMGNWVAKVSNFLIDDLDAEIGTRIRIGLPSHWLRFAWLLAAWNVGAVVTDHDAEIGLSGPDLNAEEPVRLAASLRPMGMRFAEAPAGFLDIGAEVPGHGDDFFGLDNPAPTDLAWDLDGEQVDHGAALAQAGAGDPRRLLREPGSLGEDARALVAAVRGKGSLVVVAHGAEADLARIGEQERALR